MILNKRSVQFSPIASYVHLKVPLEEKYLDVATCEIILHRVCVNLKFFALKFYSHSSASEVL